MPPLLGRHGVDAAPPGAVVAGTVKPPGAVVAGSVEPPGAVVAGSVEGPVKYHYSATIDTVLFDNTLPATC